MHVLDVLKLVQLLVLLVVVGPVELVVRVAIQDVAMTVAVDVLMDAQACAGRVVVLFAVVDVL